MIIRARAYPRAGLIGNPSDGYYGKTIAFVFSNFSAEVTLYHTPELEILPNTRDHSCFGGIRQLADDVRRYGYYGGIRLLKAAVKIFHDYCRDEGIELDDRNFTIRYQSDIPHQVGLAGSSAIITACFRALLNFFSVRIPPPVLAGLILAVERDELGISAGLQDRVAQVYEGLVHMDFDRALMEAQGYGAYAPLDPAALPPLYIAYRSELAEGSEIFHNDVRARFRRGDPEVVAAMAEWAGMADAMRAALAAGDTAGVGRLIDANFDLRARIYPISEGNLEMVGAARDAGATAKFTGSGGAIVGTYRDEDAFAELIRRLEPLRVSVIKPVLVPGEGSDDS